MSIKSFFNKLFGNEEKVEKVEKVEQPEPLPVREQPEMPEQPEQPAVQPEFTEPAPEPTPSRMTEEYKAWLQEQMEKADDAPKGTPAEEKSPFLKITAAAELLKKGGFSCVATDGYEIITSKGRGIQPLLDMIDDGRDLSGYAVADKIVGRAAAFLFVRLNVSEVYAETASRPALRVLEEHSIPVFYDTLTDSIMNREGTGLCPMETAVLNIEDPIEAEARLRQTLAGLKQTSDDEKA